MSGPSNVQRSFGRTLAEIMAAERWLDGIVVVSGLSEATVFAMRLCLEEIFSNIVRHGVTAGIDPPGVEITVEIKPGRALMTIEEEGEAFDMTMAPAQPIGKNLEDIQPGGLGILLVRSFSSRLSYNRIGNRNRVTAEFSW